MRTFFLYFKWITTTILAIVLVLYIYILVTQGMRIGKTGLLLIAVLIGIFLYPGKISWVAGVVIFLYGIYNILFIAFYAAVPTVMQFTSPIVTYLIPMSLHRSTMVSLLMVIPDYFYLIALIVFLLKPVRQYYHINR